MRLSKEFIVAIVLTGAALMATAAHAHDYKAGALVIAHPWTPKPPAGAKVAAGFLKITNEGKEDDRLVAISAEVAGKIQIHGMKIENGIMKMFELAGGLAIPAGQTVELKSKSNHVMFMGLKTLPAEGQSFTAVLTFEKAGEVPVEFAVEPMGGDDHGEM
ncbi:copper chaperone PCu(A)C [Taklimakanibacter deserti]|uniref:copper chaperone PCu(A)C n=1 Tax=Taklimakanibacter deserti TaxID=2267839 RepID=UPI000E64CE5D